MLCISRLITAVVYCVLVCTFGRIYCLFDPRDPKHAVMPGRTFDRLAPLHGLKAECRIPADAQNYGNAIYVCNYQNNYDMVAAANIVQSPTATVGKKSPLQIPSSGRLYWSTGNSLIDRNNRAEAHSTATAVVNHFKKCCVSIQMFPEGTRSRGRSLLPSKTGAPHVAIAAGAPVIPVCVSTIPNKIKLNRLNNGLVIVEMLPPADISHFGEDQIRELIAHCHILMEQEITELDKEIAEREAAGKV